MISECSLGDYVDLHCCFAFSKMLNLAIISLLAWPGASVVSTNMTSSRGHQGHMVCVNIVALRNIFIWKHMNHSEEFNVSKSRFYTFLLLFLSHYDNSIELLTSVGCHGNHVVLFLGTSVWERVQSSISVLFDFSTGRNTVSDDKCWSVSVGPSYRCANKNSGEAANVVRISCWSPVLFPNAVPIGERRRSCDFSRFDYFVYSLFRFYRTCGRFLCLNHYGL